MAHITMTKPSGSGAAMGGIGAGSVELLPDGEFHYWQIANPPRLTTVCGDKPVDDGEGYTGALSFWVRAETGAGGRPVVRKLGLRTEPEDFTYRMYAWNKPVQKIEFDNRFPVCELQYIDEALPIAVTGRAVAPFVPHHSDIAATPGFYMDFEIRNPTAAPVTVSLLGTLVPSFANEGNCRNELHTGEGLTEIILRPETPSDAPNCGSLFFSLDGDAEISHIAGEFARFLREYVHHSAFGVSQESALFQFRESGRLPSGDAGARPAPIPDDPRALSDGEADRLFAEYARYPFAASLLERIRGVRPLFPENNDEKKAFLEALRSQIDRMSVPAFGAAALCGRFTLQPGETRTLHFTLAWHFPNHFAADGRRLGHYYENLFRDAAEAGRFLTRRRDMVHDRAAAFSRLLYDTTLPGVYPDSWSGHLATLVKSAWYLRDGRFGLWEGQGYCGFHTTDITYHAAFGLIALFPDLQLKQMRMGAAFQRADGRVHHFFTPDLEHVDDGFDRVDMNNQFVLMVWRDYLFTGDRAYLRSMWDHVVRAMASIEALDGNGDGLPDTGTRRNTYDAWNFSGTSAYISLLWLAALKAAAAMAGTVGDTKTEKRWAALLARGRASLEALLWNGEYYDLWRDDDQTDECLMTDQLDGEWFLRAAGLEGNLPDGRVREVLRTILSHNFDPDGGLINASCPAGKKTTLFTHKNCQAEAVWTGIGYAMAALSLSVGLRGEADSLVTVIHDNQSRFGALWNHWECGHHYTRPLSSWTTLNAALGLRVNMAERTLSLRPIPGDVVLPLCLPGLLATLRVTGGAWRIDCAEGSLDGWRVTVETA